MTTSTLPCRLAIIGSGALASLFAARLDGPADVTVVGSWAVQLAALRDGLRLVALDGVETVHRLRATAVPTDAYPADFALVLVKSYQTAMAAARAQAALAPGGVAVTLQNGLGAREALAAALGAARAAQGVVTLGATLLRPGVVRHAGAGTVYLAPPDDPTAAWPRLPALLRAAGFDVVEVADAAGLVWGKLAVNAGINPVTAVYGVPNGALAAPGPLQALMLAAAREVAAVAAAQGIALPFADAAAEALRVAEKTRHNRSSMLQDLAAGRPTEIDAICGAVVRAGQRLGVPTPVNARLWQAVRQRETENRQQKTADDQPTNRLTD